jgi:ADP-ribose pyrophosphatase YjhB (NUDIX family)
MARTSRLDPTVVVWRLLHRFQWRLVWLRQSKFMIGTTGLVRDDAGRVLLVRHRFWPPGRQVGLPGGYALAGERLEDALAREVREEVGLGVEVAHVVQVSSGFRLRVEVAFAAALANGNAFGDSAGDSSEGASGDPHADAAEVPLRLDPREVLSAGFHELSALPEDLMPNHRRLILENADWFKAAGADG